MKNWTGILVSALYFGPCGGLTFAADSWYNNHFVPSFNIDSPNNSTSTTFFPSYGYCGNGSFWDTSGGAGPYGTCLGVVVDPGQTVFIELAGDDFDTWGSYPAAPNHGWNGDLTITWDFHTVSFYDGIDSVVPPGSEAAAIIPGDDGLSETIPPHTALDWSGFDLTEYVSGSPPDTDFPRAYYHFNGHHFIAGLVTTYFSSAGYTSTDGTFDSGADEYMEQLGIWELDESGTQVGFWVIFVGKHTGSLSLINAPAGEGANDRGRGSRFCSDGANLWFVTPLYEVVLNPYGGQFDERAGWKYTWAPTHAAVFSFSGGGWTKIGAVDAATSNTIFFNSLVGGYGSNGYVFDATASPDEPGVLHVVTSEWGTQDGPDGVHTGIFQHGTSGTSPRQIRWQTTYAQFSSSAKTLQVPLDEYNAAAGSEADASIGSHSSNPSFCWIRNDGGTPIFMRIKGIDQFGTPSLTDTFEVYDVSGGTSSLIQTIHAADMMPARPSFWDINHFSNPDQIKQGVLSDNSQFDVGNDNQRVWLLNLFVQDSTHLANNAKFSALIRIPVNNPTIYYWFENDPTKSDFGLGLFPFSFFCELKQTWIVPANFANIYQYIRCTNYSLGLPSWQFNKLSYSTNHAFSNEWYPEFNLSDYFHDIFMKDDNFYYTSRYIENQGVGDGLYHSALVKTHILRNWYICSIDTNVVSIPAAALIRIYPNGNVKYITGDFKIIRISPDGKVHHQDATVGNAAILTISPNGDVRLKN